MMYILHESVLLSFTLKPLMPSHPAPKKKVIGGGAWSLADRIIQIDVSVCLLVESGKSSSLFSISPGVERCRKLQQKNTRTFCGVFFMGKVVWEVYVIDARDV